MTSYWSKNIKAKQYPTLKEHHSCDVLVIGGGIAGILCAYRLQQQGLHVILVEKNRIGMGITKHTTATITALQDKLYLDHVRDIGYERAKAFFEANLMAIREYQNLNDRFSFDFVMQSGIQFSYQDDHSLKKEYALLKKMGADVQYHETCSELPFPIKGAIELSHQAVCHPLKLIYALAEHIEIYEKTEIIRLKKNLAYTKEKKTISFRHVIVATHYPSFGKWGGYFAKMYQIRSAVYVSPSYSFSHFYIDIEEGGSYIRNHGQNCLIGGQDYQVGDCIPALNTLKTWINAYMPCETTDCFMNQDFITLDELPYIGKLSHFSTNHYVVTGMNGYGMTSAMIASILLTDCILKKKNPYQSLFSPQRKYLLHPFFQHMKRTLKNLLCFGGKRCTHLGCKLQYHALDKTYECPCHGSRFSQNGEQKNDPAKRNLHHHQSAKFDK